MSKPLCWTISTFPVASFTTALSSRGTRFTRSCNTQCERDECLFIIVSAYTSPFCPLRKHSRRYSGDVHRSHVHSESSHPPPSAGLRCVAFKGGLEDGPGDDFEFALSPLFTSKSIADSLYI